MIDTAEQITCKDCGKPLEQAERQGPHKREFCNGTCRKRWHRKQKEQPKSLATMDTMDGQARIAELERTLAEKDELIERLLGKKQSKQPFKRQLQERLTRLLEQRDWPMLDIHYRVKAGQKEGRVFIISASIDLLSRALGQLEESSRNI